MPQPPELEHAGAKAFYSPMRDRVTMPPTELFTSSEEYYATLLHELTHSTGHTTRLAREGVIDAAPFGSPIYLHVEVIDLLGNRVEAELGVAFFVASYSALRKAPVSPALLVLGDMSVQGNIKPLRSLTEPLQVARDNGAKRALIPIENKRNFLDVSADIMEHVDPVFYGDPKTAAMKVLGNLSRCAGVCLLRAKRRGHANQEA